MASCDLLFPRVCSLIAVSWCLPWRIYWRELSDPNRSLQPKLSCWFVLCFLYFRLLLRSKNQSVWAWKKACLPKVQDQRRQVRLPVHRQVLQKADWTGILPRQYSESVLKVCFGSCSRDKFCFLVAPRLNNGLKIGLIGWDLTEHS